MCFDTNTSQLSSISVDIYLKNKKLGRVIVQMKESIQELLFA